MAKALITGINGFTGRYLASELKEAGYEVSGIDRAVPAGSESTVFACELHDGSALSEVLRQVKPDVVVHLAAISVIVHGDVDAMYRTNVVGSYNLLEAIAGCGHTPRSIVLASSAQVYGDSPDGLIEESMPPAPANDYAVSKLAMEYMAKLWLDRLPVAIVRLFNYTGVGQAQDFLLPKLVSHFKRRAPFIELGNLNAVRDYSDVRTVARCYRLILEKGSSGEVFNICSGQGYTIADVLQMMREISGHSPEIRINPAFLRGNEVRRLAGSRARFDQKIGRIEAIPLKETLRWMYEAAA